MEKWQQQIDQILCDVEGRALAKSLVAWSDGIALPDKETRNLLDIILRDVYGELSPPKAMWVAFLLGASWQKEHGGER